MCMTKYFVCAIVLFGIRVSQLRPRLRCGRRAPEQLHRQCLSLLVPGQRSKKLTKAEDALVVFAYLHAWSEPADLTDSQRVVDGRL